MELLLCYQQKGTAKCNITNNSLKKDIHFPCARPSNSSNVDNVLMFGFLTWIKPKFWENLVTLLAQQKNLRNINFLIFRKPTHFFKEEKDNIKRTLRY